MAHDIKIGQHFGTWTILNRVESRRNHRYYECQCECGKKRMVKSSNLWTGKSKGCGCYTRSNLVGKRFGLLVALECIGINKYQKTRWLCQCDCGKKCIVLGHCLGRNTNSCGCRKIKQYIINGQKLLNPAFNAIIGSYKKGARMRGFEFNLSPNFFYNLTQQNCYYCGSKPSAIYKQSKYRFVYNGIDRLNNSISYCNDNCVPCCKICNYMKRELSKEEFFNHVKLITEHNFKLLSYQKYLKMDVWLPYLSCC